nr:MAG TPA: tail assembly chaperone protein [Caudoviricetes sp.]
MEKNLNYFMPEVAKGKRENFEIVVSDRFVDEDGNPVAWTFRLLSAKEIDELKNAAIVKKNKSLLKVDTKKLIVDTISETIIYPNLKSEELQNAYGAMNISELLDKMLEGREYERFTDKLMKAQGFMDDPDVIIGDAKN